MRQSTNAAGVIAVTDADTAGCIIWWRLEGELALGELQAAWAAAGLDEKLLPKNPSPAECLSRSVRTFQDKRRLARPLGRGKGWALVAEMLTASNDLRYHTVVKAYLDDDKIMQVIEGSEEMKDRLAASFQHHQATLLSADVSIWLSNVLVPKLEAIKLRDTGGVYFIPRQHVETLRKWVEILRSISGHVVYEVPALQSDEAVEAILAALMAEADHEIGAMETELDTEELGKRAVKTREAKCEALRAKLETYAELLGVSMSQTNERIEGVQAALVEAAMADTGDAL